MDPNTTTSETNAGDASAATAATDTGTTAAAATDSGTATAPDTGKGQGEAGNNGESQTTNNGKAGDGATEGGEGEEPKGAPESYEAFTLPEGYTLEGERLEQASALFKELNLSQPQAQKLVDAFIKADGENASVLQGLIEAKRNDQIVQWGEQSKTEFGGKYDELVADARAGVAHMLKTRPNTLDTFDAEGWGNHPDALAAFAELGRLARGSSMQGMGGERTGSGERSVAERLYGNSSI